MQAADFTEPEVFFHMGVGPVRIDIMTSVPGLEFGPAWSGKIMVDCGGVLAPVLCRQDVPQAKLAAGRPQDRQDVKRLDPQG
jgi:hypothetical protein